MPSQAGPITSENNGFSSLLFDAPRDFVHDRLATALMAVGAKVQQGELGLEMSCRDIDWKQALQKAASALSYPEQRDIRVTPVLPTPDAAAIQTAIFSARRLNEFIAALSGQWLGAMLDENRLAIHFQPLIQQPPGRLHGYECLVRGIDESGNLIAAPRLFEAARRTELLPRLDEQCRLAAIRQARDVQFKSGQLFINFMADAIYRPQTCFSATISAIEAAGLSPRHVTFEAAKADAVHDHQHVVETLRFLQERGFKVALDGIGAASSWLVALGELRPDYIKFDGDMIRRAAQSASEGKSARDLAEMARQQGIIAVASGVETEQELKFIFSCGIRITQGFVHARPGPMPADEEQSRQMISHSRQSYEGAGTKTPAVESPWDISGLYAKLATIESELPGER